MIVYYDVTRLIARHSAPTPTGIDRVDINYANYFLKNEVKVRFVYQNGGVFFLMPALLANQLVGDLYYRWIQCGCYEDSLSSIYKATLGNVRLVKVKNDMIRLMKYFHSKIESIESVDGLLVDSLILDRLDDVVYINTSHHGVGNLEAYYVFKAVANVKIVFYLHDLIPIDFPEYVRPGDDRAHAKRVVAMAEYGDLVLVNSKYTKERFLDFCKQRDILVGNVQELMIGVESTFLQLVESVHSNEEPALDGDYFVYVSTVEPRKNHMLLLESWRSMRQKGLSPPKLVILGKRGWNVDHVSDFLDRSPLLKGYVVELSGVSDRQMVSIVKNSIGFLFPSFVEGWGMPLVEAISLNKPVVCSDIPAFQESGQGLCVYIDSTDATAWQRECMKIYADVDYRESLVKNYSSYKLPSWTSHFNGMEKWLAVLFPDQSVVVKGLELSSSELKSKFIAEGFSGSRVNATTKIIIGSLSRKNKNNRKSVVFNKKVKKFKSDPVAFFSDSRYLVFRLVGRALRRM